MSEVPGSPPQQKIAVAVQQEVDINICSRVADSLLILADDALKSCHSAPITFT
jgi:hypothetical protein